MLHLLLEFVALRSEVHCHERVNNVSQGCFWALEGSNGEIDDLLPKLLREGCEASEGIGLYFDLVSVAGHG